MPICTRTAPDEEARRGRFYVGCREPNRPDHVSVSRCRDCHLPLYPVLQWLYHIRTQISQVCQNQTGHSIEMVTR